MRFRLLLFFALSLALLNGVIASSNIQKLSNNQKWVSHTNAVLFELERILSTVKDAETGARGYCLTGQSQYLEPYFLARKNLGELQTLSDLVSDNPVQRGRVPGLQREVAARLQIAKNVIQLRDKQGLLAAIASIKTGQGKQQMDDIRRLIGTMEDHERRLLDIRARESARSTTVARLSFWVATLANLALLGGAGMLFLRSAKQHMELGAQHEELNRQKVFIEHQKRDAERQSAQLADTLAKLQRAEEMRDSLTAMLVHDLRTPLTTLIGPLEMLKDGDFGQLTVNARRDRFHEFGVGPAFAGTCQRANGHLENGSGRAENSRGNASPAGCHRKSGGNRFSVAIWRRCAHLHRNRARHTASSGGFGTRHARANQPARQRD